MSGVAAAAALSGCANLVVFDTTDDIFYGENDAYDVVDTAALTAEIRASEGVVIESVTVDASPVGTGPMRRQSTFGDRSVWVALIPMTGCYEVVEHQVTVNYRTRRGTPLARTAPRYGTFRNDVDPPLPARCDGTVTVGTGRTFEVEADLPDEPDAMVGDGICRTASGVCTLRAAVMEANATAEADVIELDQFGRYALTLPPGDEVDSAPNAAVGDLDVTAPLTISERSAGSGLVPFVEFMAGPGVSSDEPGFLRLNGQIPSQPIIDGGGVDRVFQIHAGSGEVFFDRLIITNGRTDNRRGGAVHNAGSLTLDNVALVDNRAGGSAGGAIYNARRLLLENAMVTRNDAGGFGGALFNEGLTRISHAFIGANTADGGAAVFAVDGAETYISAATIAYNGDDRAAAPTIVHNGPTGQLSISWSTIVRNRGGAIRSRRLSAADQMISASIIGEGVVAGDHVCEGAFTNGGGNGVAATTCAFPSGVINNYGPPIIYTPGAGPRARIALADGVAAAGNGAGPFFIQPLRSYEVGASVDIVDGLSGGDRCRAAPEQTYRTRPVDGDNVVGARCDSGAIEFTP